LLAKLQCLLIQHFGLKRVSRSIKKANFKTFRAKENGKEIKVVYHLHGETGWSMVCANGKQNS